MRKLNKYDWTTVKNFFSILLFIGILFFLFCGEWIVDKILEPKYCTVTETTYSREMGSWEVTIKDGKGNYWTYYDSDYRAYGEHIYPVWSANGKEIIDIEEE